MRLSIIIPVYNSEDYLEKCLMSVSNQTFRDFECILVDDGSTDSSGDICDKWANTDPRFIVIHQDNKGVSEARNVGISVCKSDWLIFIDSDDWIDLDYLAEFEDCLVEYPNTDLIFASSKSHYSDGRTENYLLQNIGEYSFDCANSNVIVELLDQYKIMPPWGKLYRTSVIRANKVSFPKGVSYGEDLIFNLQYLKSVNKFTVAGSAIYNYNVREGSLSKNINDFWNTNYIQWIDLYKTFQERNIHTQEIDNSLFRRLWGLIYDSIFATELRKFPFSSQLQYIQKILSIPEISDPRFIASDFPCSQWIKAIVTHRLAVPLVLIKRAIS